MAAWRSLIRRAAVFCRQRLAIDSWQKMVESLILWLPVLVCGIAVYHDLRSREIPDWLPVAMAVLFPVQLLGIVPSLGWWQHLFGGLVGLILGLIVGYGDRFGGGDIKLFAALCLWFGVFSVIPLAMWIAIAGLPVAIIAAMRKQSDFAYAPAIFLGVCVHVMAPTLLNQLVS